MQVYRLPPSFFLQLVFTILIVPFFFTGSSFAQGNPATAGSGYCLDFTPNVLKGNYVDLGNLSAIDTGNFSIEMWVNVNACKEDPPFFSNKDWSSGNNPGMVFDVHDNGNRLRINLKPANSTFQNIIIPVNAIGRGWFHLAVTFDRKSFLNVYIDGILKSSTFMNNGLKGSFASPYTYKLGQDGTGAYSDDNGQLIQYDGKLDEVRIWTTERTEEEIKANMCRKVSPSTPNLYAYYNCDATSGITVSDLKGGHDGKWVNALAESWTVSGAAVGDTSIAQYPDAQDWNGKEMQLSDPVLGSFKINQIQAVEGMHVYKVNSQPGLTKGLITFQDNQTYYGVFMAGATSGATYAAHIDYTTYANAIANESSLKMFTRNQNSDHIWSEYLATQQAGPNLLTKTAIRTKHEFILGNNLGLSCAPSTILTMGNKTDVSCTMEWQGGAAKNWNIQWGNQGFELGKGSGIWNKTTNSQNIISLKAGLFYDFYVQDSCATTSVSYWVGPFTFYPQSCLSPTDFMASQITEKSALLTWKGNGYKSDVEWGLAGFVLGQGIPDSTFNDSLLLKGLTAKTNYAYYVKSNCPLGSNNFIGPFTFKTLDQAGIDENELSRNFVLFPNPAGEAFSVQARTSAKYVWVRIYNAIGKEIFSSRERVNNGNFLQRYDSRDFPKGMYLISITDGIYTAAKPIIIQ